MELRLTDRERCWLGRINSRDLHIYFPHPEEKFNRSLSVTRNHWQGSTLSSIDGRQMMLVISG